MTEERARRKLSGILSADAVGYSRLMQEDEASTIRNLEDSKKLMSTLIEQFKGRIVDAIGDNLLAEFGSVVDATECAVKIQKELKVKNDELPDNRKMEFRIGVNLGDVVEEGGRIYGDGINIAARIEGLAEPGGICISGVVYDQVKKKLNIEYQFVGQKSLKNIEEPVHVYRVLPFRGAASQRAIKEKVERMAFPLPDKPSLAVLPFDNMSGDPEQEYFSDGLTEQIISTLSKIRNIFVIARNSTFTYKGKPVKVQKVAEDLGVKYVLEGSVQKTADRIRIIAQLIDAITGHHVWSERYDREPKDIFAIQDDITMEITKAMRIELLQGEQARIWDKRTTTNLNAYEKLLQGNNYFYKGTKADNMRARQIFEESVALHPGYANAHSMVGWTHFMDVRFGWVESRVESIKMAFKHAQKAIAIDDTLDYAHTLVGAIYLIQRQHEKAVAEAERAVTLNPNGAHVLNSLAAYVSCAGRWEEGMEIAKKALRLEPFPPVYYFHWLGRAYFMTGRYEEAINTWKEALHVSPNYLPAHAFLAACYISLDRQAEAKSAAEEVLRIDPKFSLKSYAKTLPYKNEADIELYVAALRKAGLK